MHYRLDPSDRIVEVTADWDDFSQANGGGSRSRSAAVIGQPLLDFVAGDAPRMFVRAALQAARVRGEQRALPYRCDSPTHRRYFKMVVSPLQGGHVLVEHLLLRELPRLQHPPASLRHGVLVRCSQCLASWQPAAGRWVPADECPADAPPLAVCPACADRLAEPVLRPMETGRAR